MRYLPLPRGNERAGAQDTGMSRDFRKCYTHSLDGLRGRMAVPLKTAERRVSLDKIDASCGLTASSSLSTLLLSS